MTTHLDVLIVDDSAAIRKILQRVLAQSRIEVRSVVEAANGAEALEKLEAARINLVFSDINMPVMDGMELLQRIRSHPRLRDLPVIMVTTEASQNKVLEAVQGGATAFVCKPFTADEINSKVAGLFRA